MRDAIIPKGVQFFPDGSMQAVSFGKDTQVKARIIAEDIQVTEFIYKGKWYTIDTNKVRWM